MARFTARLSEASGQTVSVQFATANGTATAPADYTALTGTVTFNPGQLAKTISIHVETDTIGEVTETYFVNLSNATNAMIADPQGVGTIIDDDGLPTLSIGDVDGHRGQLGHGQRDLHGLVVCAERPDRQRRLGDGGRHRDCAGPITRAAGGNLVFNPGVSRTLIVRSGATPSTRSTRHSWSTSPTRSMLRSRTARASARSPTTTTRRACPSVHVTVTEGDSGDSRSELHSQPQRRERTCRHGRLRDRQRDGDRAGRLCRRTVDDVDIRPRPAVANDHRPGER